MLCGCYRRRWLLVLVSPLILLAEIGGVLVASAPVATFGGALASASLGAISLRERTAQ